MKTKGDGFPMTRHLFFAILFLSLISMIPQAVRASQFQAEATRAYAEKRYQAAIESYGRARDQAKTENRTKDWVRFTAQIIRCHLALGETDRATGEAFLLCMVEPRFPPLDCIVLPWATDPTSFRITGRDELAENLLDPLKSKDTPGPAATLLAAATLSISANGTRQHRGRQLLSTLSSQVEPPESRPKNPNSPEGQAWGHRRQATLLAQILLWKQEIPRLRNTGDLDRLRALLEETDESLRAGPLFLYGQASARIGDHENAVLAWMKIPILYPEQKSLAIRALREAADSLDKLRRADQATALRQEAEQRSKE